MDAADEKIAKLEKDGKDLPDTVRKDIAFEMTAASLVGKQPDAFSGKPRREIMEAVLSEKLDSADFKNRSDEYVQVRYDILLEDTQETLETEPVTRLREASSRPLTHKDMDDLDDKILANWQSRGSAPLRVSRKGA